jgi:hypothetical protein
MGLNPQERGSLVKKATRPFDGVKIEEMDSFRSDSENEKLKP